jgi:hypothetical protein
MGDEGKNRFGNGLNFTQSFGGECFIMDRDLSSRRSKNEVSKG